MLLVGLGGVLDTTAAVAVVVVQLCRDSVAVNSSFISWFLMQTSFSKLDSCSRRLLSSSALLSYNSKR